MAGPLYSVRGPVGGALNTPKSAMCNKTWVRHVRLTKKSGAELQRAATALICLREYPGSHRNVPL
jgi:hypothetical protein